MNHANGFHFLPVDLGRTLPAHMMCIQFVHAAGSQPLQCEIKWYSQTHFAIECLPCKMLYKFTCNVSENVQ